MDVKVEHKGEDYYAVTLNGRYYEVSISEGHSVKALIKVIMRVITKE